MWSQVRSLMFGVGLGCVILGLIGMGVRFEAKRWRENAEHTVPLHSGGTFFKVSQEDDGWIKDQCGRVYKQP